MNNTEAVIEALKKIGEPATRADIGETDECLPLNPDQISRALHDLVKRELIVKVGDRPITDRRRGQGKSLNVYALQPETAETDIDAELARELIIANRDEREHLGDTNEQESNWQHIERTLAERIEQRDTEKAEAVLDDGDDWSDTEDALIDDQQTDLSITNARPMSDKLNPDADDPVIREIARYREPQIQDGQRLASHLLAGATVLQDRLPGLATSMREAANALQEFAA